MHKPVIIVCGILDTKGKEINYLRERINEVGGEARVMEISLGKEVGWADIPLSTVLNETGKKTEEIVTSSRDAASSMICEAGQAYVKKLYETGEIDGIISYGGSMGATISTSIMRSLPIGVPKMMLTTMASGDVRPYVGSKDITMMYPIAEAGLNVVTRQILSQAAAGIVGMAMAPQVNQAEIKPLLGCMMFGVTTPCVLKASAFFEEQGDYDVIINHSTGAGGRSMEEMIEDGFIKGLLDITTHELVDERFGGVLSAGADRLTAAAKKGIPQVLAPGGLEIINFGPRETIPKEHMDRVGLPGKGLYIHNATVTCIGTSPDEIREIASEIAQKLNTAKAPTTFFIPMRGWSAVDIKEPNKELGWSGPGPGVCWIEDKNKPGWSKRSMVFYEMLKRELDTSKDNIEILVVDKHLNEPEFALLMANVLNDMLKGQYTKGKYADIEYVVESI